MTVTLCSHFMYYLNNAFSEIGQILTVLQIITSVSRNIIAVKVKLLSFRREGLKLH
jgi:hypothetical protein